MISFIPILIIGVITTMETQEVLKERFVSDLELITYLNLKHVETYFNDIKLVTHLVASNPNVQSSLSSGDLTLTEVFLKEVSRDYPNIAHVDLIDLQGIVIVSSLSEKVGSNKSQDINFIKGKEGIHIKDIHLSLSTERPAFGIFEPVVTSDGVVNGVILMDFYAEGLYGILEDIGGLGESGEIYLLNKEKYMITPSRFLDDTFLKQKIENIQSEHCFESHESHSIPQETYVNYRGVMSLGAHFFVSELNWCLITEFSEYEVLKPINIIKFNSLIVSLILIVIIFVFALFYSDVLTRPIKRMTSDLEEISQGKIDVQLPSSNIFEYQVLIDSLNRVLASLKLAILRTKSKKGDLGFKTKESVILGEEIIASNLRKKVKEKQESRYDSSKKSLNVVGKRAVDSVKSAIAKPTPKKEVVEEELKETKKIEPPKLLAKKDSFNKKRLSQRENVLKNIKDSAIVKDVKQTKIKEN